MIRSPYAQKEEKSQVRYCLPLGDIDEDGKRQVGVG